MANGNDLQASGNVSGNLRIENTPAINLMALPAIKVDTLTTGSDCKSMMLLTI